MVKNKMKPIKSEETIINRVKEHANKDFLMDLAFDPRYLHVTCWFLLGVEIFLNLFIVHMVKYTEIDWIAYMQEVEGFLNGTLDYKLLKGDTGPLVYPAGFVYIYSFLYFISSQGQNIRLAQYIFSAIYIAQLYFVFEIYKKTAKVPPYALIITTLTSYRMHSIYVLRLFNDPIAVLLFYMSLNLFLSNKWMAGSIVYSLAVSIKMNILLYAPCLLTLYLTNLTIKETIVNLFICGAVQLILGMPFLIGNPVSYIKGSFDLGRVFEHKWTVNYRFLSQSTFENRYFHIGLLMLHILLLLTFLPSIKKYLSSYAKLNRIAKDLQTEEAMKSKLARNSKKPKKSIDNAMENVAKTDNQYNINFDKKSQLTVLPFFVTNFIGVVCARSLHYQFYCWYFHSLLYLTFCTKYKKPVIFLLLGVIEMCWNTYPSTNLSSILLHICHVILLFGNYNYMKS